jgi:tRNA nucleotidyltransferase (CCA-adding enzyme)
VQALLACECDARGRTGLEDRPYPQGLRLHAALETVLTVDTGAVAAQAQAKGLAGPDIGKAVRQARVQALAAPAAEASAS